MYEIQKFNHEQFTELTTLTKEDSSIWFVGKEIAKKLGYAKPENAIAMHCKGSLKWCLLTAGGKQNVKIIPESDLYRLIMRSNMPEAEDFQDWVCEEVLPAIRKTGKYAANKAEAGFLSTGDVKQFLKTVDQLNALANDIRRLMPNKEVKKLDISPEIQRTTIQEWLVDYLKDSPLLNSNEGTEHKAAYKAAGRWYIFLESFYKWAKVNFNTQWTSARFLDAIKDLDCQPSITIDNRGRELRIWRIPAETSALLLQ